MMLEVLSSQQEARRGSLQNDVAFYVLSAPESSAGLDPEMLSELTPLSEQAGSS